MITFTELILYTSYKDDKILIKCNRCGIEIEVNRWVLDEIEQTDQSGKLTCICMECSRRMHIVNK